MSTYQDNTHQPLKGLKMDRVSTQLSHLNYGNVGHHPVKLQECLIDAPDDECGVLRMLVSTDGGHTLRVGEGLSWTTPVFMQAYRHQLRIQGLNRFVYLTVRHGIVNSVGDDEWHVDGYSERTPHKPEQNYVWSDWLTTHWVDQSISIPADFDPLRHNINTYLQQSLNKQSRFRGLPSKTVCMIDPYVLHRRNPHSKGWWRTFIRYSFTEIPIVDVNNTPNLLLPFDNGTVDGVKDFRDTLVAYPN